MTRANKEVIHKLQNKFIGHLRDAAKSGSQMLEVFAKISCKLHTYINQEQVSIQYTPKFRLPSTTMQWGSIYQHLPGNKGIVKKRKLFPWIYHEYQIIIQNGMYLFKGRFLSHISHSFASIKAMLGWGENMITFVCKTLVTEINCW